MDRVQRHILSDIFKTAWQFVKKNGFTMREALITAWTNYKLRAAMMTKIVKFYYQKVDGSIREAYGTLKSELVPETGNSDRANNDTVSVYFDTERESWRSYKKANLIRIA